MKLSAFVDRVSFTLEASGRFRMCAVYDSVVRSVSGFCSSRCPTLGVVYTRSFLHRYEEYLIARGCRRNTISFYLNGLRSIGRCAADLHLLPSVSGLFDDLFMGSDPTGKRAVSPDVIARLHCADLSSLPCLSECRDLFMLSFHLQGMSFVDLAYLCKSDVEDDHIVYRRRKTGSLVTVPLEAPAREIIARRADASSDSPYLLPIVTLPGAAGYLQYQNALRNHNRRLKSLASYLGITDNLTSYVSRHSWATIAYHNDVPVSLVSQAMGHHTEEVTRIYLASFARARLLEAGRTVYAAILRPIEEGRVRPVVVVRKRMPDLTAPNGVCRKGEEGGSEALPPEDAKNVRLLGKDGHLMLQT